MLPGDFTTIDEKAIRRIADLGFTGVGTGVQGDPNAVSDKTIQNVRAVLEHHGIKLVQFTGPYPSIITTDEAVRQTGVKTAQDIARLAAKMGASFALVRPTSMNLALPWSPHPDNYLPATEDRLVRSLREITSICDTIGVPITLECHKTSTLNSPEAVRRIIERTESSWIKINMDPVNFISDFQTAYNTTDVVNQLFDILSPYVGLVHVKDVYVENRHVVHISETVPGDGIFDFDTLFRRFEALMPDGYALIEHLPDSLVPQAMAFVARKLAELNITVRH
jgi:sugar phosphate isomerase/epimerase